MADRLFEEPDLAALYDSSSGERDDFDFYRPMVMAAHAVLDVGCGTGAMLAKARAGGHAGRLCGLDPARGMIEQARKHPDIEWILGDLSTASFDAEFDLIVMTGHAFQVFTTDDDLRAALAAIRAALSKDGHFAFETRNPAARAWEGWTSDRVGEIAWPDGHVVRVSRKVDGVEGDLVTFTHTFVSDAWAAPMISRSTLRFLAAAALSRFLAEAGLAVAAQYGDWDGSPVTDVSREIITIAGRA